MSFPKKTLSIQGKEVEVSCEKLSDDPCHCYKFTAQVGDTSYEHSVTIGAIDGPVILPTQESLQAEVDRARRYAAERAHFHHHVATLAKGVV